MSCVIVVGSGVAGLVAALRATAAGHEVTLLTKAELSESNTRYAQGGLAAAVFDDDSVEAHIDDTMRAAAGLAVREAVEILCAEGPARIADLIRWGIAFDRSDGGYSRGLEAAHSNARVLHSGGDATGAALEWALVAAVRATRMTISEHIFVTDLCVRDGRVVGVDVREADGAITALTADAVILATGGAGQLYPYTTNPAIATGDGVAVALRAGALLRDLEFYQFHPTALALPGSFLISEAVRGEGAVLLDARGERFMRRVHPDAELAPRDVVARAIATEMAAQGGAPVQLDAVSLGADTLERRFPTITAATRAAGLDWTIAPIPVTPAAHYWMGGVATDLDGRTSLPGLFAVGEVANTGVHGANRLASNSLLEAVVFGWRVVDALDEPGRVWPMMPTRSILLEPDGRGDAPKRAELQELLWHSAGLHRDGERLAAASATARNWSAGEKLTVADHETANLADIARVVLAAASARRESRGAHFRVDHPFLDGAGAHHQSYSREARVHAHR